MDIQEQFNEIYNAHASKVYRLCLGYASGDEQQAKEWQQESFVKVWKYRKSFKGDSSVSTWIFRIAVNVCLSDLRKSRRREHRVDDLVAAEAYVQEDVEHATQIEKMYQCINHLSENNKFLILMELEEIPQSTIAETMGVKHGAIRTRLSRVRKALLKCIKNEK